MAREEVPPFPRGETYAGVGGTIDLNDLGGVNIEGSEFVFAVNAQDRPTGIADDPSGRFVRCKVVRNKSGVNLKPARVAHYRAAYPYETQVDGYCFAVGDRPAGIVDEYLPAAGVPANDLFYIVIEGPTSFTNVASAATFAVGDRVVPATGTSATNDDAGRVAAQATGGATATLANNIQNTVGYADAANAVNNGVFFGVVHRGAR